MSEPIKVGDLVMIVRGHECALRERGGIPFTVARLVPQMGGGWRCPRCGTHDLGRLDGLGAAPRLTDSKSWPLSWLLKIDPPALESDTETREELIA